LIHLFVTFLLTTYLNKGKVMKSLDSFQLRVQR